MRWSVLNRVVLAGFSLFLLLGCLILVSVLPAKADVYVNGYYRKNGTYVAPHYRSDPDGNFDNNWSTKGNVNPYTGAVGTKTSPSSISDINQLSSSRAPTTTNIQKEINVVKTKYRANPDGFRERLISQIVDYLNADKGAVESQVYSLLPDIKKTQLSTSPVPAPSSSRSPFVCNCSKTCPQMISCSEAQYQLNSCGCSARDADHDGIACDTDCQ